MQGKNCIYWIQIFSLKVTKEVVSGESTAVNPDELFLFKVNVRGTATVTGQLNAAQIDSSTGDYGEMQFTSNGSETTTAIFGLVDGQTITGVNLSEGLSYEVIEYLTVDQAKRYAAMPMNGAGSATESLEYNGETYEVIRVNTFSSTIGENKARTDVDPYTSALTFSNIMPVCKITDMDGKILYRRYDWDKVTNKNGEKADGGSSTEQPYYYAPAVFTELTGVNGAFKALEGTLYVSNGSNPISYSVSNGVQIQMLIGDYKLIEPVIANTSKVTLTTASSEDTLFPKQDAGTTSTIRRTFTGSSMFNVSGDLTIAKVILDGVKGSYTVDTNGGIVNVENSGKLTIQNGAKLQNSRIADTCNGGAVYVASGGTVTMTGGTVNHNESGGDGAGIYLTEGSTLNLSGTPSFGGTGTDVSGNITTTNGNFKTGDLVAKLNGGKHYTKARQDIYIAGYDSASDDVTSATSMVVNGNITSANGTIWVWAQESPHYKALCQFAKYTSGVTNTKTTLAAFRNAQDDATTGADQVGEYLYGITKEGDTENVFWLGLDGFDVMFKKTDSYGKPLAGAKFSLYTDTGCENPYIKNDAEVTSVSADGSSQHKDSEGNILDKGTVYFEKLPVGIYYMKETQTPVKDPDGKDMTYVNENTYVILVGESAFDQAGTGVLTDITEEDISKQRGTGAEIKDYAVFQIVDGRAVSVPDINTYGIVNVPEKTKRVILRKTDDEFNSLKNAVIVLHRCDMSVIDTLTSNEKGIFFTGKLPYGTYYLHETEVPDGVAKNGNDGWWYTLTVTADGCEITEQRKQP